MVTDKDGKIFDERRKKDRRVDERRKVNREVEVDNRKTGRRSEDRRDK